MTHYKNLLLITVFSLSLVTITGCGGSPTSTFKQFHAAVKKGDMDAVGKVSTQETMGLFALGGKKITDKFSSLGEIKETKETINGNTATVQVRFTNGELVNCDLKKVDGRWKVHIAPPGQ